MRLKFQELGIDVAIKKYFPAELSVRKNGTTQPSKPEFQDSFEDGSFVFAKKRTTGDFRDCPNSVTCRNLFRANGMAYMVMEYVSGLPLSVLLKWRKSRGAFFTGQELLALIRPMLTGLTTVHESEVCH